MSLNAEGDSLAEATGCRLTPSRRRQRVTRYRAEGDSVQRLGPSWDERHLEWITLE